MTADDAHPRHRWVIFGGMAAVYYAFGAMVMSIPPMVTTVRDGLGISRTEMGLALGAWALIYVVTAPPAGRFVDRIGLRRSLLLGALFVAGSGFARAAAQGLGTLWLAIAIFGVGGPLVSASAPKLIATWFPDPGERRLAVGFATASPALGGMTSLLITNSVLLPALDSWRGVIVVYSLLALAAGLVWVVLATLAPAPPSTVTPASLPWRGEWRALLASPGVRLALILGVGSFFVVHALASWLPNALETDSGLSATTASNWAALSLAIGIAASLVLPRHADDERRHQVIVGVMGVLAVSLLALAVGPVEVDVIAACLMGVRAALVPLVIVVLMEADGVNAANMGMANGLWFSAAEVGGTTGPLAVGAISDTSAGFGTAMAVLAGVLVAMMAVLARQGVRAPQLRRSAR